MNIIKTIKARGYLKAGVSLGINGLSYFDQHNKLWKGFDIDFAKAISTALLGNCDSIEFIPLQSNERFSALQENRIDIGTFNATLTLRREVNFGLLFIEPILFDGEAFMVRNIDHPCKLGNMKSRVVSAIRGSTTLRNLENYFIKNKLSYEVIEYNTPDQALSAYELGDCNIHCLDRILLAGERLRLKNPDDHIILPDIVTREAMSPVVSCRDPFWYMTAKWIIKSLIEAEELNISQANIKEKKSVAIGYEKEFLEPDHDLCNKLGVIKNFVEEIITQVGNYADIYHRHLGDNSKLKLTRGENTLRSNGGLLFSPLFL